MQRSLSKLVTSASYRDQLREHQQREQDSAEKQGSSAKHGMPPTYQHSAIAAALASAHARKEKAAAQDKKRNSARVEEEEAAAVAGPAAAFDRVERQARTHYHVVKDSLVLMEGAMDTDSLRSMASDIAATENKIQAYFIVPVTKQMQKEDRSGVVSLVDPFNPQSRPITVKDWILHIDNHLNHLCREMESVIPAILRLQVGRTILFYCPLPL
eukprot:COSAG05_NODE_379_length_10567_cov_18.553687_19_plen_213_part_00